MKHAVYGATLESGTYYETEEGGGASFSVNPAFVMMQPDWTFRRWDW